MTVENDELDAMRPKGGMAATSNKSTRSEDNEFRRLRDAEKNDRPLGRHLGACVARFLFR